MTKNNKLDKIVKNTYSDRLKTERSQKGKYSVINLPKNQERILILPIQNLFYGNKENPPRLEVLLDHIKRVNDMEEGAFIIAGNLFYYPAGSTDEKLNLANHYAEDLSEILRVADKNKILFLYNGTNESKFIDDRKLKFPIETTSLIAQNLNLSDRFYADTNVEIDFAFTNELTLNEKELITSLFTSVAPISSTINAIANKTKQSSDSNVGKNLIVDTSSGKFYSKKRIIRFNENPNYSQLNEQTIISPAGYTNMPQISKSKQTSLYNINSRLIELSIRPLNLALTQDTIRETNTIKKDPFSRIANCPTIGVNYNSTIDFATLQKLNDIYFDNLIKEEMLKKTIEEQINHETKEAESLILTTKNDNNTEKTNVSASYTFE